jgi:hypothetical protein
MTFWVAYVGAQLGAQGAAQPPLSPQAGAQHEPCLPRSKPPAWEGALKVATTTAASNALPTILQLMVSPHR